MVKDLAFYLVGLAGGFCCGVHSTWRWYRGDFLREPDRSTARQWFAMNPIRRREGN